MSNRARAAVVWTACGALLAFFATCAALVVESHVRELRTFRPVEATIVESVVRDGPGRGANYYPHVSFRYVVDGSSYVSSTYRSSGWTSERPDGPQAIVARYVVGSRHTAWYDPAAPSTAVLARDLNVLALALALLGAALPVGILVLFRGTQPAPAPSTLTR